MKSAYGSLVRRVCIVLSVVSTLVNLEAAQKPAGQAGPSIAGLYRGTLSTQQIVLEIDDSGSGRYFYSRIGKAIKLKGARLPDGAFRIREQDEKGPSGAEWRLSAGDGGQLSGSFCKCDVRQATAPGTKAPLPIALTKAAAGTSYNDLLLDFPLQTGPEVASGDQLAWVMQTDTRFKADMPHITRFPDKAVMEKVNHDLAERLKKSRLGMAAEFQGDAEEGTFSEEVRPGLLSREVFSLLLLDLSFSPGTAYPAADWTGVTYDMRTGREFDWKKFFRSAEEIAAATAKDTADEATITHLDALDRALFELAFKYRGKPADGCDDDASAFIESAGSNPAKVFTKDGLSLNFEMRHAEAACGADLVVPYSALAPLVRKESPLYFMVAGDEKDRTLEPRRHGDTEKSKK